MLSIGLICGYSLGVLLFGVSVLVYGLGGGRAGFYWSMAAGIILSATMLAHLSQLGVHIKLCPNCGTRINLFGVRGRLPVRESPWTRCLKPYLCAKCSAPLMLSVPYAWFYLTGGLLCLVVAVIGGLREPPEQSFLYLSLPSGIALMFIGVRVFWRARFVPTERIPDDETSGQEDSNSLQN